MKKKHKKKLSKVILIVSLYVLIPSLIYFLFSPYVTGWPKHGHYVAVLFSFIAWYMTVGIIHSEHGYKKIGELWEKQARHRKEPEYRGGGYGNSYGSSHVCQESGYSEGGGHGGYF